MVFADVATNACVYCQLKFDGVKASYTWINAAREVPTVIVHIDVLVYGCR